MIPEGSQPQSAPSTSIALWLGRAAYCVLGFFLGFGGVTCQGIARNEKGSDVADVVHSEGYRLSGYLDGNTWLPKGDPRKLIYDLMCPEGCSETMKEEFSKLVWNPKFISNLASAASAKWEWLAYHPYRLGDVTFVLYADGHTEMVTPDTLRRLDITQ